MVWVGAGGVGPGPGGQCGTVEAAAARPGIVQIPNCCSTTHTGPVVQRGKRITVLPI